MYIYIVNIVGLKCDAARFCHRWLIDSIKIYDDSLSYHLEYFSSTRSINSAEMQFVFLQNRQWIWDVRWRVCRLHVNKNWTDLTQALEVYVMHWIKLFLAWLVNYYWWFFVAFEYHPNLLFDLPMRTPSHTKITYFLHQNSELSDL